MRFFSFLILATFSFNGLCQTTMAEVEKRLAKLGNDMIMLRTEEERLLTADSFADALDEVIGSKESFKYAFDEVKNLSKLHSPDNVLRIYSWATPLRNGSFSYNGRLVVNGKDGFKVVVLKDGAQTNEAPEYIMLKPENWYGAIYYDIISTKHKSKTYYTLFGYRPDKSSHNEKILDVLELDSKQIRFGERIFNTPVLNGIKYKKRPYRLIFRYSPKTVANLKYVKKEDKIVMDHLSVPDASLKENWKMYGPDFSYDALFWKKGQWQLEEGAKPNNNLKPTQPKPVDQGLPEK